jgi:tetratricopeptide (TPR) repeat protein
MQPQRLLSSRTLVFLVFAATALVQGQAAGTEQLGQVNFTVSCDPAVQPDFSRAVALLHSFWFDASAKAFEAVTQKDPSCGMAYWGVAMTWLGNPFGWPPNPQALQEGWAVVEKAKALGGKTPREHDYIAAIEDDYIAAIEVFYKDAEKIDHRTRALAYERAMEELSRKYPDDREAAIFYALALNATALPTDKTYANQLKAAEILEKIFAEQPNHPGVAHYLIHSYDYPAIAERGLSAARRYASIAPSAPHALHMPSHIFTRRGFWQESIESNRASAAAARNQFDQLHGMDYLAYAYLQLGQDQAARRVLEDLTAIEKVTFEHFVTAYAMAAIPSRYALERRQWAEAAALTLPKSDFPWNRFPQSEAVLVFAHGLGAVRSGDVAAAKKDVQRLQELRDALATAKLSYWVEQVEIQQQVVCAWVAYAEGQREEGLQRMRTAADREDTTDKHPVTPGPLIPARELLGEMLLEANQPQQARQAFEASMTTEPNRFWGLYGAARAAELAGDRDRAQTYYAQLVVLAERADSERPALLTAKAFVGKK